MLKFIASIFGLLLTISSAHAQNDRLTQYAESLKTQLSRALIDFGSGDVAAIVRKVATESEDFKLADLNALIFSETDGAAFPIPVHTTAKMAAYATLRMQRSGLVSLEFVQSLEAAVIEKFRGLSSARKPSVYRGLLAEVQTLSQRLYPGQPEGEIRVGLLDDELSAANSLLQKFTQKNGGLDGLRFTGDPSVRTLEDVVLPRPEFATRGMEAKQKHWMKVRKWLVPTVALGAGIWSGFMNHQLAAGIAVGLTSLGLEFQFAHFNGLWNSRVWSRFGFKASVVVNLLYPMITKLSELGTMLGQSTVEGMHRGLPLAQAFDAALQMTGAGFDFGQFAVGTAFSAVTFVASIGAVQVALATLKKNGEMSETPRFIRDTALAILGNAGRILGIVSNSAAGPSIATSPSVSSWRDPLNPSLWAPGQWINLFFQAGVVAAYTGPLWVKILRGDAAYDRYTAYLASLNVDRPQEAGAPAQNMVHLNCDRLLSWVNAKFTTVNPQRNEITY